jgi:hypothetical protein
MGQPKRLTEDQQAVARKAYPLATTEVVRFVRRNHPLVWEHALKVAFVLLGAQPPTIVAKGRDDQKVKKYANDLWAWHSDKNAAPQQCIFIGNRDGRHRKRSRWNRRFGRARHT